MDETRFRQRPPDCVQFETVVWSFVSPARLSKTRRVHFVEFAEPVRNSERFDLHQRGAELGFRYLKIRPRWITFRVIDDDAKEFIAKLISSTLDLEAKTQESGFRRNGQLRMRVEHEP